MLSLDPYVCTLVKIYKKNRYFSQENAFENVTRLTDAGTLGRLVANQQEVMTRLLRAAIFFNIKPYIF